MSSTITSALSYHYREGQRLNKNNSAPSHRENKSEQDSEDKTENTSSNVTVREVCTVDKESNVCRIDKSNKYSKYLTSSKSLLTEFKPDDDYDDQQLSDIVIVGDTDAIIDELKTENADKEKKIQELLMENKKLKKSCGQRHVKRRSIKFRDKISEIRRRSNTLPSGIQSFAREMSYRDSWLDSASTLPDIADQPLLFRESLHETKEQSEKNRGLPELQAKSSWQFSEFMLL